MNPYVLIIFLLVSFNWNAQITISGNEGISPLVTNYKEEWNAMPGYRLQICFDNNKSIVDEAKKKFLLLYPKINTYMVFEDPNFNLMVGDFRTLIAAEKIKLKIQGEFTVSIIHKAIIKLPRID